MGVAERKEREKEQRRQEIIAAAEKVFFKQGVDNATMDDVAEQSELSKATLYLYFSSKEEIYAAIYLKGQETLFKMIDKATDNISDTRAIPDPRRILEDGQWATCVPVSASTPSSLSLKWMPWA